MIVKPLCCCLMDSYSFVFLTPHSHNCTQNKRNSAHLSTSPLLAGNKQRHKMEILCFILSIVPLQTSYNVLWNNIHVSRLFLLPHGDIAAPPNHCPPPPSPCLLELLVQTKGDILKGYFSILQDDSIYNESFQSIHRKKGHLAFSEHCALEEPAEQNSQKRFPLVHIRCSLMQNSQTLV